MKRLISLAGSFVLILTAAFSTMGALISAFSFTADAGYLFWICLAAALALASLAGLWRGKGILLFALPALAFIILNLSDIIDGAKWAAFFITNEYNKWIEIPVLFHGAAPDAHSVTLFFAAAGVCLSFLLSFAICLRRSTILTVIFTAPLVFLTFVLTNYQSNLWYLIELLAVYLTLLISGALYPDDFLKRGTAVFPAILLALALLGITYLLTPVDNDKRGELITFIDDRLRFVVSQTGFTRYNFGVGWPDAAAGLWRFNTDNVRVSDAGPRTVTDQSILEVTADRAGSYYLRGYSMQLFDGRSWHGDTDAQRNSDEQLSRAMSASVAALYGDLHPDAAPADTKMTIEKTGDHSSLIYLPYYTYAYTDSIPYYVNFLHPDVSITSLFAELPVEVFENNTRDRTAREAALRVLQAYTKIDNTTAEGLRKLAVGAGIDPDADRTVIADSVAKYVSSSARYTLSPFPIPDNEDFALYFLQTSKQGYCIHFATAATLMLRALDVPARFTSGFVVTVPNGGAGDTVVVTDGQAHAWVEVFYDNIGWVPLEVTPAGSGIPAGMPHTSAGGAGGSDFIPEDRSHDEQFDFDPGSSSTPSAAPETAIVEPGVSVSGNNAGVVWIIISCTAACAGLLVLRQFTAQRKREKVFTRTDTNAAVIRIWRYIVRLSGKETPPEDIEGLALKARFSRHRITEDERAVMLGYAAALKDKNYKRYRLPGRLWLKYILLY